MAYTSWRGVVGCVKPGMRPGSTEDLIRLLPEGIGLIPLHLDVTEATTEQFTEAIAKYEPKIAELAEQKVDLILPECSAPFQILGYEAEKRTVGAWEKKYKTPMFTSLMNHVHALKALEIKKFVGIRPLAWDKGNRIVTKYFTDAGFKPLGFVSPGANLQSVSQISSHDVYGLIKQAFLEHPGAEGIYMLGSAMRVGDMVETIEQDFGVPVVSALTARAWEIQKRLHVRQKREGYGVLLREMP
jgi:maleate cis-trans isomerase